MRRESAGVLLGLVGWVVLAAPQAVLAQETGTASATQSADRLIFLPSGDLLEAFSKGEGRLVVPLAEYRQLIEAARSPARPQNPVLTRAEYTIVIEEKVTRVTARLMVNVPESDGGTLPLRLGLTPIGRLSGSKPVFLESLGKGEFRFQFQEGGEQTVELEMALRPGGWTASQLQIDCPTVPLTSVEVTILQPNQVIDIGTSSGWIENAGTPVPEGNSQAQADVGATNKISVRWKSQPATAPQQELLASVDHLSLLTVGEDLIHTDHWLSYTVRRQELQTARIALPADEQVLDVESPQAISGWKIVEGGEGRVLEISLTSPATGKVPFRLQTERPLPAGGVTLSGATGVRVLNVMRESGQIAIRAPSNLSLNVTEQQRLIRLTGGDIAAELRGGNAYVFRFYSPDYSFHLTAQQVQPRLTVQNVVQLVFRDQTLDFTAHLEYSIERAGIFELTLQVPEGLTIDDVFALPGQPQVKDFNVDAQTRRLIVTLSSRTEGRLALNVKGHQPWTDTAGTDLPLPLIEPLGVEREVGSVQVFAPESVEVVAQQSGLQGVTAQPVAADARRGGDLMAASWSFTRRPVVIPVRMIRQPARIAANVATAIDVQPELAQVKTNLDYIVSYAGIDTFRFDVPEAIGNRLRIEVPPGDSSSAPIKQKTASSAENGRIVWTVLTQREVLGQQRFQIAYELGAEGGTEGAKTFRIEPIRPLPVVNSAGEVVTPLTQVQGEVSLQKDRMLSLSAEVQGGGIETVDIRELTLLPKNGALAYRYFRDDASNPVQLTVTSQRFEIQNVVTTVVSRGLVEVVTSREAEATYRCRYRVKTSERQRLLVFLPVNLEVLGAFLNDREVRLERAGDSSVKSPGENWTPFWINVGRTDDSETPFLLTFQFLWKVNPPLGDSQFGRGQLALPLPILGGDGTGVVQELKVAVWVPDDYTLVGSPRGFELKQKPRFLSWLIGKKADRSTEGLDRWISEGQTIPSRFAELPTEGRVPSLYQSLGGQRELDVRWWRKLSMTLTFSITVALIGWILTRTSWENRITMVLLAAFLCALYGLSDSHGLAQGLSSASYGILLTVALWILHGLLGRHGPGPAPGSTSTVPPPKKSPHPEFRSENGGPVVP